jgi:hypothetical protein
MADFPYTPSPANVSKFLDHIQDSGVPSKVTQKHLESVGFKSSNDRYLISVLKFIGFLNADGSPTDSWKSYRDKSKAGAVLADALTSAYSDLFSIYPDAYRKDEEALHNYFASRTGLAKGTVEKVVRTFKVMSDRADFAAGPVDISPTPAPSAAESLQVPTSAAPVVNINIQLQLPPTDDESVYDKLFAALKKHLFS